VEDSKRSTIVGANASYDIAEETKLGFVAKLTFKNKRLPVPEADFP